MENIKVIISTSDSQELPKFEGKFEKTPPPPEWTKYVGLVLTILSAMSYSLAMCMVKLLPNHHPFNLVFWRNIVNVIPSILIILYLKYWRKDNIFDEVWPITKNKTNVIGLTMRGIFGATTLLLKFLSLNYLTILDSSVIMYSNPIFIVVLAHFYLEEKCAVTSILIGIWTLFGVAVIARPPFLTGGELNTKLLIGVGVALGCVICSSCMFITTRQIRSIHFAVMTFVFGIFGMVVGLIAASAIGVLKAPEGLRDIGFTCLVGLFSYCGQMCLIFALKFELAGPVGLLRSSDILFALLWQITFLNVWPDLYSVIGAVIVIAGIFIATFRKWIESLPEENLNKKLFGFLLR